MEGKESRKLFREYLKAYKKNISNSTLKAIDDFQIDRMIIKEMEDIQRVIKSRQSSLNSYQETIKEPNKGDV